MSNDEHTDIDGWSLIRLKCNVSESHVRITMPPGTDYEIDKADESGNSLVIISLGDSEIVLNGLSVVGSND